jgi:hypothetical protein
MQGRHCALNWPLQWLVATCPTTCSIDRYMRNIGRLQAAALSSAKRRCKQMWIFRLELDCDEDKTTRRRDNNTMNGQLTLFKSSIAGQYATRGSVRG